MRRPLLLFVGLCGCGEQSPEKPAVESAGSDSRPDSPAESSPDSPTHSDASCGAEGESCCDRQVCDAALSCEAGHCTDVPAGWSQLPAVGLPAARVRALAVAESGAIFAALEGYGVYESQDSGATFEKLGAPRTANDPGVLAIPTLGINAAGEPVIGVSPPGSGTTTTMIYRFDRGNNRWVTATADAEMNLGGYFPLAIRVDVDGSLLSTWPFRNDIMRSTDGGTSWTSALPVPNPSHTPPNGPSASVKAVYGVGVQSQSGELVCGTEGDQWWHSVDRGQSWAMVDEGGSSNLALEPGQNGMLVAFNKDGEALIGTQGKADGNFLMRIASDGQILPSNTGFPAWAMVGTANQTTVLRELVLTSEGYNFLAMPVSDQRGGQLPCDLYGSADGSQWEKLNAPFVPELNALAVVGKAVLVGGGESSPGVIWKYRAEDANNLPRISTGVAPGVLVEASGGLELKGRGVDPEGAALSFQWKARGPGPVQFADPTAAETTASFTVPGDYVLTLHGSDGLRSAGAPVAVRVGM